jgi:pilus assembly protein CpaB
MAATGNGWRKWLRVDVVLTCVALAAGGGAAVLAGQFLTARVAAAEAELAQRFESEEVVVASTDIRRGDALDGGNLALRKVPREFLPADAIRGSHATRTVGRRAAINIARGTPILAAAIADESAYARLSSVLEAGERAVTVAVDDLSSQAGNLRAGDRIDLFYGQRDSGNELLVPLLQQVQILAVGDSYLPEDDGAPRHYSTVTLRVSNEDAPRVLLAQQAGDLAVLLRGTTDNGTVPGVIRSSSELLRQAAARPAVHRIEVLTGGHGQLSPERTWLVSGASVGGGGR